MKNRSLILISMLALAIPFVIASCADDDNDGGAGNVEVPEGGNGGDGAGNDVVPEGGNGGDGAGNDVVPEGGNGGDGAGNDVVPEGGTGGDPTEEEAGGAGGDPTEEEAGGAGGDPTEEEAGGAGGDPTEEEAGGAGGDPTEEEAGNLAALNCTYDENDPTTQDTACGDADDEVICVQNEEAGRSGCDAETCEGYCTVVGCENDADCAPNEPIYDAVAESIDGDAETFTARCLPDALNPANSSCAPSVL